MGWDLESPGLDRARTGRTALELIWHAGHIAHCVEHHLRAGKVRIQWIRQPFGEGEPRIGFLLRLDLRTVGRPRREHRSGDRMLHRPARGKVKSLGAGGDGWGKTGALLFHRPEEGGKL